MAIFFKKWANPGLFFHLFSVFSNKHYKFLQQIYVKKCPSSIRCWDLNPRPFERESLPITTRPGLPLAIFVAQSGHQTGTLSVPLKHAWHSGRPVNTVELSVGTDNTNT